MIFLWSKSNRPGSKLIRWGRGDDCSHFAICWDGLIPEIPQRHYLITESRFSSGVKADWMHVFQGRNDIEHALRLDISRDQEQSYYMKYITEMGGKQYDKGGVLFFSLLTIAQKFGIATATSNPWGSRNKPFCTETANVFQDLFDKWKVVLPGKLELMDPHDLYSALQSNTRCKEISLEG